MQIKIKSLTGKEMTVDVEPTYTIAKIKELLEEKEGIPPPQQRLIFGGRNLVDDQTADASGIKAGATLHLILSLRG
jgi:ubiquitin-like protein Nedd8